MYGDFVLQVDEGVGHVMKRLKDYGLDDNTLVFFSSDNGPVWYDKDRDRFKHDAVGGLRGMKFASWEGGHRMPFVARWPKRIVPEQVNDQPIVFSDLFATLAELTNAKKLPAKTAEDSVSFAKQLVGANPKPAPRPPIIHDRRTVRDGDWKLILPKNRRNQKQASQGELYNLADDPGEQKNLFVANPAKAKALTDRLRNFLKQIE